MLTQNAFDLLLITINIIFIELDTIPVVDLSTYFLYSFSSISSKKVWTSILRIRVTMLCLWNLGLIKKAASFMVLSPNSIKINKELIHIFHYISRKKKMVGDKWAPNLWIWWMKPNCCLQIFEYIWWLKINLRQNYGDWTWIKNNTISLKLCINLDQFILQ